MDRAELVEKVAKAAIALWDDDRWVPVLEGDTEGEAKMKLDALQDAIAALEARDLE